MGRSWWRTLGIVLLSFVTGALLGAVSMYRGIDRHIQERLDSSTWAPRTMSWLDKELSLSTEQRSQCEPIVQHAVVDLIELRDQSEAERKAILGRMFLELIAKLPTEQQSRLQDVVRKGREPSLSPK